jgi:hypothetical protein
MDWDFDSAPSHWRHHAVEVRPEPEPPMPEPGPSAHPDDGTALQEVTLLLTITPPQPLLAFDGVSVEPTAPPTLGLSLTLGVGPGAPAPLSFNLPPLVLDIPPAPAPGAELHLNIGNTTLSTSFDDSGPTEASLRVGLGATTSVTVELKHGDAESSGMLIFSGTF